MVLYGGLAVAATGGSTMHATSPTKAGESHMITYSCIVSYNIFFTAMWNRIQNCVRDFASLYRCLLLKNMQEVQDYRLYVRTIKYISFTSFVQHTVGCIILPTMKLIDNQYIEDDSILR